MKNNVIISFVENNEKYAMSSVEDAGSQEDI